MHGKTLQLPRFPVGHLVATPGAIRAMKAAGQSPMELIDLHRCGNFGTLDGDDARYQTELLAFEGTDRQERMISQYTLVGDSVVWVSVVWVITEADRSVTTILLPSEY